MPRSVNHIDFHAFVLDGYVLREDSDTTFTLQVVVVQYQLLRLIAELGFLTADHFGCVQHLIDQGRFSVVNVCNNCYISNVLHMSFGRFRVLGSAFLYWSCI